MHVGNYVNFAGTLPSHERSFCVGAPRDRPDPISSRCHHVSDVLTGHPLARFYASCTFEPFPARHKALMRRVPTDRPDVIENAFHVSM
ncbi:hypothetical protein ACFT5C_34905 [Streptomyces sp. NPDC057116]|uniref:hypothetical protein n=1 Tax=Streptomyces sp. NPDC057116 TaxID=3346023 RepID=UPI00362946B6